MESRAAAPLAVAAFVAAIATFAVDEPWLQRAAASAFAICLGSALVLWGVEAVERDRVRGRRVTVRRADHPIAFWGIVLLGRFLPGLAMIAAGSWLAIGAGG